MPGFYRQPLRVDLAQEIGAQPGNHDIHRPLVIAEMLALPDVRRQRVFGVVIGVILINRFAKILDRGNADQQVGE